MNQQLSLDIESGGTAERDTAIELVGDTTDARFLLEAQAAVEATAKEMSEFTTDDVRPKCKLTPREPRVWGWVMNAARKDGIAVPTPRSKQSNHRPCHHRPKRIWQSKIFEQATN